MKSFSELTSASQVNNEDLLAISQTSGSGYASKKTTVKDITDKSNLNLAEEYDSTSTYAVDDYVIYESALYKCIASTTGAFDSTKWTSVVVTDEMGSGGGGAGHTIKDDGGNALTQRSNLQFKGVYSHDDSTNSASVVEVAREMTWAEYQLLSASEKKGLITITDRTGDSNPLLPDYSTTEHKTGRKWIDGKDIWECTFMSNYTTVSGTSWQITDIYLGDKNIDLMTSAQTLRVGGDSYVIFDVIGQYGISSGGYLQILNIVSSPNEVLYCITLQYTKL